MHHPTYANQVLLGNPNKHMRIQNTVDGISYESGDELSETESDYQSSNERLNGNAALSTSPSKDPFGRNDRIETNEQPCVDFVSLCIAANRLGSKRTLPGVASPHSNTIVRSVTPQLTGQDSHVRTAFVGIVKLRRRTQTRYYAAQEECRGKPYRHLTYCSLYVLDIHQREIG